MRNENVVAKMLPSVVKALFTRGPQLITDMVVDQRRALLYTLTDQSTVGAYSLADAACAHLGTFSLAQIGAQIAHQAPHVDAYHLRQLIKVDAIDDDRRATLVATTPTGARVYFTVFAAGQMLGW